jgi:NADPH-dependent 2,4-dienoyl-CoA reductase/sulfur reductase-like enzyme/nitrite reductase/ring-hydroxylating ferredoxin subunit
MYSQSRQAGRAATVVSKQSAAMGANNSHDCYSVSGDESGYNDVITCNVDDLSDGQMKEVEVPENKKILVVRDHGQIYALSSKCTHYGAPLAKGALCNGRIQCPWHGACFSVTTGDIEDYPGLDSLQKFKVTVVGTQATIHYKASIVQEKRVKAMCRLSKSDHRTFLIIGGGAAGALCAQNLRQNGYQGNIIMATREKHLPYDRPKLSKALDASAEALALRKRDEFEAYDIVVKHECKATKVDFERKSVSFNDGTSTSYDKLLLCTGGSPQTLNVPGKDLGNIYVLRSVDDGNNIAATTRGKNVVVIGQSFIGLEVAAFLVDKATSITVLGRADIPLKLLLGDQIGSVVKRLLEERGVKFLWGNSPKEFLGDEDGKVKSIVLTDGTQLEADVCILGIGVRPTTEFLKNSGIVMSDDGYILVDKRMRTNIDDVYAAGDIVKFPLFILNDKQVNIQHWQMACKHGEIAGTNMAGKEREVQSVPFFWTVILGKSLRYTGYGTDYDDVIIHGDLSAYKFVAFLTRGDTVIAVASMNYDPIVAQAAQLFHSGRTISKQEILLDPQSWIGKLANC